MFSIFNYKKGLAQLFSKDLWDLILKRASELVISYVDSKDLLGYEKKQRVDQQLIEFTKKTINSNNSIVNFVLSLFCDKLLPIITQNIYDSLKAYIDGLTTKA